MVQSHCPRSAQCDFFFPAINKLHKIMYAVQSDKLEMQLNPQTFDGDCCRLENIKFKSDYLLLANVTLFDKFAHFCSTHFGKFLESLDEKHFFFFF